MKLYLASFLEPENFGPGKVIGVALGQKPKHISCQDKFEPFIPKKEVLEKYYEMVTDNPTNARNYFSEEYEGQLNNFCETILAECKKQSKSIQELLPFEEGDTLASWERYKNSHYRNSIASVLERLGYKVVKG